MCNINAQKNITCIYFALRNLYKLLQWRIIQITAVTYSDNLTLRDGILH